MTSLHTATQAAAQVRKAWTPTEDEYLRAHAAHLSIRHQALVLRRSRHSVQLRRLRLGIRVDPPPRTLPSVPALRDRISAQENRFLSLLGWRHTDLEA